MNLNQFKYKDMIISFAKDHPKLDPVFANNRELVAIFYSFIFSADVKWNIHVSYIVSTTSKALFLTPIKTGWPWSRITLNCLYYLYKSSLWIRLPYLELWCCMPNTLLMTLSVSKSKPYKSLILTYLIRKSWKLPRSHVYYEEEMNFADLID